jgi:hypothetical protein
MNGLVRVGCGVGQQLCKMKVVIAGIERLINIAWKREKEKLVIQNERMTCQV